MLRSRFIAPRGSTLLALLVPALCAATGCAARGGVVQYAQAHAIADTPNGTSPPLAVAVGTLDLVPLRAPIPNPQQQQLQLPPSQNPIDAQQPQPPTFNVIDNANRAAAQGPEQAAYFNAIQEYVYVPGTLFQLYAAPMRVTDIALQPGERIIGQPASGDIVRWVLGLGKSIDGAVEQQHVYLKPTRPGLHTNLIINTSKRSYFLELHSYKETYMASVKWRYPQDEVAQVAQEASSKAERQRVASPVTALEKLNFGYVIKPIDGSPTWTPTQVFDDGHKTFIRFPPAMLAREAPVLFVMRDDETQIVNYRVKQDIYIVDRLLDVAELRLGQKNQEVVRITREGR